MRSKKFLPQAVAAILVLYSALAHTGENENKPNPEKITLVCHIHRTMSYKASRPERQSSLPPLQIETRDIEIKVTKIEDLNSNFLTLESSPLFSLGDGIEGFGLKSNNLSTTNVWSISRSGKYKLDDTTIDLVEKLEISRLSGVLTYLQKTESYLFGTEEKATGVCNKLEVTKNKF